jgi:hypothetical protein
MPDRAGIVEQIQAQQKAVEICQARLSNAGLVQRSKVKCDMPNIAMELQRWAAKCSKVQQCRRCSAKLVSVKHSPAEYSVAVRAWRSLTQSGRAQMAQMSTAQSSHAGVERRSLTQRYPGGAAPTVEQCKAVRAMRCQAWLLQMRRAMRCGALLSRVELTYAGL